MTSSARWTKLTRQERFDTFQIISRGARRDVSAGQTFEPAECMSMQSPAGVPA